MTKYLPQGNVLGCLQQNV